MAELKDFTETFQPIELQYFVSAVKRAVLCLLGENLGLVLLSAAEFRKQNEKNPAGAS